MKPTLRARFERFCFDHRNWGIPNLMMIVIIGTAIVFLFQYVDPSHVLYRVLCWDRELIFRGQIWRLFSYVFIPGDSSLLLLVISLAFDWFIGKTLERIWGRLRFTIYYLTGVLLTDIVAIAFHNFATAQYLNLSLFLAFATLFPENGVMVFFVIPLKMKYLAWVYFAITILDVISALRYGPLLALVPIIPLLNYLLFFGKDIRNVLPFVHIPSAKSADFRWKVKTSTVKAEKQSYRHKCTVCGRTDTEYPELEFRYCSRCAGYRCYCEDHINHHVHITES